MNTRDTRSAPPVDSIVIAVSKLVDDAQTMNRDPSRWDLDSVFRRCGLDSRSEKSWTIRGKSKGCSGHPQLGLGERSTSRWRMCLFPHFVNTRSWGVFAIPPRVLLTLDECHRSGYRLRFLCVTAKLCNTSFEREVMEWNRDLIGKALAIAETDCKYLRVMAGPGTGKTFAMKRRVARLLEQGTDPERLLVVTFTRVAAASLVKELGELGVEGCTDITACTLHSFCFRTLNRQEVFEFSGTEPTALSDVLKSGCASV